MMATRPNGRWDDLSRDNRRRKKDMPKRTTKPNGAAPGRTANNSGRNGGASLGFEAELWLAAEKLRGHLDAAEYKHVVLGLVFLKYISDAFAEQRGQLELEFSDPDSEWFVSEDPAVYGKVLEERDEYAAKGVFWVPAKARWDFLQKNAKQPTVGRLVDDAMEAIERENPALKGVLPKDYARPTLDKARLGELIDLIGSINFRPSPQAPLPKGEGRKPSPQALLPVGEGGRRPGEGNIYRPTMDVLGRVYEYFLGQFASAEGKKGGQFYTPRCVVRVLVEMLAPYKGRVYDPCCGSGGMFVQSEAFLEAHGGSRRDISVFGQESNPTTWKLARMNLAIRGIEANLGPEPADSFLRDLHPDLRADYVLANPPFNAEDWGCSKVENDARWKYGRPPRGGERRQKSGNSIFVDGGNANFAWVQHFVHHLAPSGMAGFVLANGSMSSNQSGEGDIRRAIVEADLVDCMVALPGQLFYSTQIPVCLWFLAKNKADRRFRERRGETLFIDARKMGVLVDRVHRDLTDADIAEIAGTYHLWRGDPHPASGHPLPKGEGKSPSTSGRGARGEGIRKYEDRKGFCKSATLAEIEKHGFVLTPGRYVGAEDVEDDGVPFAERFAALRARLEEQFAEGRRLEKEILRSLKTLDIPQADEEA
jgi:type I restriction enzyme M protein